MHSLLCGSDSRSRNQVAQADIIRTDHRRIWRGGYIDDIRSGVEIEDVRLIATGRPEEGVTTGIEWAACAFDEGEDLWWFCPYI